MIMSAREEHLAACAALREQLDQSRNILAAAKEQAQEARAACGTALDNVSMQTVVSAVGDNPASPEAACDVFDGAVKLREDLETTQGQLGRTIDDVSAHITRCMYVGERLDAYMAGW